MLSSVMWGRDGEKWGKEKDGNECAGIPSVDSIVSSFDVARQAKYVAKMSLGKQSKSESRIASDMWAHVP